LQLTRAKSTPHLQVPAVAGGGLLHGKHGGSRLWPQLQASPQRHEDPGGSLRVREMAEQAPIGRGALLQTRHGARLKPRQQALLAQNNQAGKSQAKEKGPAQQGQP
jgi:hypothetical protein